MAVLADTLLGQVKQSFEPHSELIQVIGLLSDRLNVVYLDHLVARSAELADVPAWSVRILARFLGFLILNGLAPDFTSSGNELGDVGPAFPHAHADSAVSES